jgi:imidazolonepropionase-like amidohydrolase
MEAIVDEAHNAGVMVTCHAAGGPGVLRAVKAGVDTFEHGNVLDAETGSVVRTRRLNKIAAPAARPGQSNRSPSRCGTVNLAAGPE